MSYIQNAVSPLKNLTRIQDDKNQHVIRGKDPLTYLQYTDVLQAAATLIDSQERPQGSTGCTRRSVYHHDVSNIEEDYNKYEDCSPYDIDSPLDLLQAHVSERKHCNPNASMPKHRWVKVSRTDQESWDTLSEETKIIILEKAAPPSDPHLRTRQAQMATLQFIEAQIHILNVATKVNKAETFNNVTTDDNDDGDDGCTLLANAAAQRVPPTNI